MPGVAQDRWIKTEFANERSRRKGYRHWRNRAIVCLLIEIDRVLSIPDEYDYQDPISVSLLHTKVPPKLGAF